MHSRSRQLQYRSRPGWAGGVDAMIPRKSEEGVLLLVQNKLVVQNVGRRYVSIGVVSLEGFYIRLRNKKSIFQGEVTSSKDLNVMR